jgi:hypothetical protein
MLIQMLIDAGKHSIFCREEDGENSVLHREALDKIDEINTYIRASNPEKYWQPNDPEYRKLTSKWDADRAVRKAKNAP